MKPSLCLFVLLCFSLTGFSQGRGSLHVEQDSRIARLISKQKDLFAIDSAFNGYRIHIFMEIGNEALDHARAVKAAFETAFPDIPAYLTYVEPYFRLRVGDFRNRVEAEKCLRLVKPKFKEAFVTADKIYQPKIER